MPTDADRPTLTVTGRPTSTSRLIIDRSILLLLSTSKCCLRPLGADCLRSSEARRQSILAQIKASVSIIMAIVKCSVFSAPSSSSPWAPLFAQSGAASTAAEWLRDFNSTHGDAFASSSSSISALASVQGEEVARHARYLAAGASQCWPASQAAADYISGGGRQQQRLLTSCPAADNNSNKLGCAGSQSAPHEGTCNDVVDTELTAAAAAAAPQPLQIMNYFLQTWSGTQSAHDAINNLQVSLRAPILAAPNN